MPSDSTDSTAEAKPVRGDWLVLHLLADPENLNPLTSNDSASNSVLRWIMAPLLTLDNETLDQRPVIAAKLPLISDDKLSYTFELRPDVTFSDGTPLTSADVLFTLKAIKNQAVRAPHTRNYYQSVRDVVAQGPHKVRFVLREPYFRNHLVLGAIQPLPRHHYDPDDLLGELSVSQLDDWENLAAKQKEKAERFARTFNEDFNRNPLGPGAFYIKDTEADIVTGAKIVLRRRQDFWAPNDPAHGDAWVNRVLFRIINDREAALVAFKRGDLDVLSLTPIQHRRATSGERFKRQAQKKEHVSPGFSYIGWNLKRPIFQDKRVRKALSFFVDKQNIIDKILLGLGVPVESPIFIERPEYNDSLPAHVFDPEQGKALLAEAGWADADGDGVLEKEIDGEVVPLRFEIISNSGNDIRKDVGLTVIDEMKRAGVDASFRQMDWGIMLGRVRKQDFDAVILGWGMSVVEPDPYQIWHSSQAVEGGSNAVSFKNEEVDQILEAYRVEFDPARRKEMMDRFQEIIYEEQPYAFLFMQTAVTTWDRRFQGVTWYPSGGTDVNEWWVPAEKRKYR